MLEQRISELNQNIEKLIAVLSEQPSVPEAVTPQQSPSKPAPKQSADRKELTVEDVRDVLKRLAKSAGKDASIQLLAKYGANKVPDLSKSDYAALVSDGVAQIEASS